MVGGPHDLAPDHLFPRSALSGPIRRRHRFLWLQRPPRPPRLATPSVQPEFHPLARPPRMVDDLDFALQLVIRARLLGMDDPRVHVASIPLSPGFLLAG